MAQPTTSTTTTQSPATNTSPSSQSSSQLPAILMLHGGGSNATVFKIQSRRLIWNLSSQFRFVFAEAPLEGAPGFGMLPVFASVAPFYRWVSRKFNVDGLGADSETVPGGEVKGIDDVVMKIMEENGGRDSFVGVLGFSQGARLVAGFLMRQLVEMRDLGGSGGKFRFGVVIGGPFPPIALAEQVDTGEDYALLGKIPTVHAWGREDHIRAGCERMFELCEKDNKDSCFKMDFAGGHHLPLKDDEARDLCDLILAAWYAGGGQFGVQAGEKY